MSLDFFLGAVLRPPGPTSLPPPPYDVEGEAVASMVVSRVDDGPAGLIQIALDEEDPRSVRVGEVRPERPSRLWCCSRVARI